MWNASHLAVRLCALRHWKRVSNDANHTIPPPPSYEGYPLCPKDKNRSPFHGEKPLMVKNFLVKKCADTVRLHRNMPRHVPTL